jgi:hypothetical protein
VSGAVPGKVFLAMLLQAGFADAEIARETGFNTSPVTKGVTIRAVKQVAAVISELDTQHAAPEEAEARPVHVETRSMRRRVGGG